MSRTKKHQKPIVASPLMSSSENLDDGFFILDDYKGYGMSIKKSFID